MAFYGKAPLTSVYVGGDWDKEAGRVVGATSIAQVYQGAVPPSGVLPQELQRLVDEGYLEKRDAQPQAGDAPKVATVEEILTEVGDDKDKAVAALAEEKAGKNRKTLVEPLEAIVNGS